MHFFLAQILKTPCLPTVPDLSIYHQKEGREAVW